ncbi:protein-disulfide reductase DsbD [Mesorhizobium sp.]|uniref:protein-disulfide reductase DsbD n=1 Tax=Mesorhizobium sp. TaxID=1871066 RepID=UPI0025DBF642|nr:protein-disulfide reductase DsbD [Mesorhizobium sp.]
MPYARVLAFVTLLLSLWVGLVPAGAAGVASPDQVFQMRADRAADDGVKLTWRIAPGHYLYRDKIAATVEGRPVKVDSVPGTREDDPNFGLTEIYLLSAEASVPAADLPEKGKLIVVFQGCHKDVICYPPVRKAVDLETLIISDAEATDADSVPKPGLADGFRSFSEAPASRPILRSEVGSPNDEPDKASAATLASGGLLSQLVAFLGLGLLLSLTPCVFPMIPILSGMLARSGEQLSLGRGVVLSATYVFAMATAYGLLGVFAAWSGQNLQAVLQTPVAIAAMSFAFIALALSMFGLYEIQLPQSWTSRLTGGANGGSVGGAAVLGFASALIVGPCVTPPLAAALVFVAQTGEVVRGSLALFALGLGMGLPLLLVGLLGVKVLPRSGPWLVRVKHLFGFVFVGLAIWMVARVAPVQWVEAAWGAFFVAAGAYILPLSGNGEKPVTTAIGCLVAGLSVIGYGGTLGLDAAFGDGSPLRPLAMLGVVAPPGEVADSAFRVVKTEADLDEALGLARIQGRPVMVDFTAAWCVECKLMDRAVFSQEAVREKLHDILLVRADLTNFGRKSQGLMDRFGVVGPPTVVFLDAHGSEIRDARVVGSVGETEFLDKVATALRS